MKGHLATLRVIDLRQNQDAQVSQEVSMDALEEKEVEDEFKMIEKDYIPTSETVYEPTIDVYNMIKAVLKVHEKLGCNILLTTLLRRRILIEAKIPTTRL